MLDVHPPLHAAHGWRDFFVHIVTIVIGLLIALGLEQSAEGVHHRNQVREARDAIAQERAANQHEFVTSTDLFRRETKRFQTSEIELAEAVLIAHYRFGGDMRNLHSVYPDFAPAPTTDELLAIVHESDGAQ